MTWRHALDDASSSVVSDARFQDEYPRFAPISSEAFNSFTDLPARSEVSSGTVLIEQGATPKNVLLVFDGLVRLDYLNPDGSESMLGLRTSGWYAGAAPVMTRVPSVYSVTTVGSCSIAAIPAEDFWAKLMQNTRFLSHFISTLCRELTSQGGMQAQLMSSNAEDRLACFLREREVKHLQWTTFDPLPLLKQMELAQLLAIKPETLSRIIHKLCREKLPQ
jgi:CRP-like cAMP-binding protein